MIIHQSAKHPTHCEIPNELLQRQHCPPHLHRPKNQLHRPRYVPVASFHDVRPMGTFTLEMGILVVGIWCYCVAVVKTEESHHKSVASFWGNFGGHHVLSLIFWSLTFESRFLFAKKWFWHVGHRSYLATALRGSWWSRCIWRSLELGSLQLA